MNKTQVNSFKAIILTLVWAIVLLHYTELSGQSELIINKGQQQYEYSDQLYRYEDLENILKDVPVSYELFKKYKSKERSSRIFGWTSIGLMGVGIFKYNEKGSCSSGGVCVGQIEGVLLIGGGLISGILALVLKSRSYAMKTKSIEIFNDYIGQEMSFQNRQTYRGLKFQIRF